LEDHVYRLARTSLGMRSVTALVTVAVVVLGLFSLGSLRQELIPSFDMPAAFVMAVYPGSAPEVVESQVTVPIEDAARAVTGVEEVTSTSSTSVSVTTVEFEYGTNMDTASQELTTAVGRVAVPGDVEPTVFAGSMDDMPVVQLAVSGSQDEASLTSVVQDVLVPRLAELSGVRSVDVSGVAEREITVEVDLMALMGAGMSIDSVTGVLQANGVTMPAGTVTEGDQSWSVQIGTPVVSLDELAALPLSGPGGQVLRLDDVADIVEGSADVTSLARFDGDPALAITVTKTPSANTVEVSDAVGEALSEVAETLTADGVEANVVWDQAPFIEESIDGLATEGLLGLAFAVVVIMLFLFSLSSTAVSGLSIPLSLLVAFTVMRITGYSLNLLTLSALTIAIGRVVDDSIVVIENIKRHLSYGEAKEAAILTAVREVGGAITASTLATAGVFIPIGMVGGMMGELFRPFAMTVAIAMAASLFVALTIVPVLGYWFIPVSKEAGTVDAEQVREHAEAKERKGLWQRAYLPALAGALRRPVVTLLLAFVVFGGTLAMVPFMETNLIGGMEQNSLTVTEKFLPGTSLDAQDAAAREVEQVLADVPDVLSVQTTVGSGDMTAIFMGVSGSSASFTVTLDPDVNVTDAQVEVRNALADLGGERVTGIRVTTGEEAYLTSTVDLIVTAADVDVLADAAAQVTEAVRDADGVLSVENGLAANQEVIDVTVDREAAAAVGLTETAVSQTVAGLMYGAPLGSVDLGDGPVSVNLALGSTPASRAELAMVPLMGSEGPLLLGQVASIDQVEVPSAITRVDGQRSATVSVTPAGQDVGGLTTTLQDVVDGLDLPVGATVTVGGIASEMKDAFSDLSLALILAITIVYVVMVATFRSLVQPLILLVSVPFAATGALLALLATSTPLGVPAMIGLLMLVGVVVSNAIVLIDLINQYRAQGMALQEAITEGARKRLRPIVMTAAATIFALLPMAVGVTGGGAFISQPLALVVIGGLLTSTLLTLIVVPVLYTLSARPSERRRVAALAGSGSVDSPEVVD
jgi:multidrug efflux pump subunit AcrB